MNCKYFNECGSCTLFNFGYEAQLTQKITTAKQKLALNIKPTIIPSMLEHYRNRAEYRIWHENNTMFYAMTKANSKEKLIIDSCPKADTKINALMPQLLNILTQNFILKEKLFGVEFLSTQEEMLVTLLYHKKLDTSWENEAKQIASKLNIKLIGRSRKIKKILSEDFAKERLSVGDKIYHFNIYEGSFSQPNRYVNEGMIAWVKNALKSSTCKDLLELYCGHGNFTIPLSSHFQNILATEISKSSIKSALENCSLNQVTNITFLRMSSEELVSALKHEREFFRLKNVNLESFNFSHIFVDPPRAGLDKKSIHFIQTFKNIIYISCSVESLQRDLQELTKTHHVTNLAFFDQFPYTHHLESGVILSKKS